MDPDQVTEKLIDSVRRFLDLVRSLDPHTYRRRVTGQWSTHEITAHLTGWNRLMIEACETIRKGMLPGYFGEIATNMAQVNARLVEEYAGLSQNELCQRTEATLDELLRYASRLPAGDLTRDFGVRVRNEVVVTLLGSLDVLAQDYDHHREQILKMLEHGA
jgi:hypothetical protein